MYEHFMRDEKDRIEAQQDLVAWQTALLMNATGNYKKQIKPSDLMKRDENTVSDGVSRIDKEEKDRKLADLKAKFK